MIDLKDALNILELIIATLVVLIVGDYLGYKFGRLRLVVTIGIIALVAIIAYVIYAVVVLQIAQ